MVFSNVRVRDDYSASPISPRAKDFIKTDALRLSVKTTCRGFGTTAAATLAAITGAPEVVVVDAGCRSRHVLSLISIVIHIAGGPAMVELRKLFFLQRQCFAGDQWCSRKSHITCARDRLATGASRVVGIMISAPVLTTVPAAISSTLLALYC